MTAAAEMFVILLLLLGNGLFAMSEMALVSARKSRLRQRADAGDAGARAALDLAENPGRFLATVQIGITLVGVLAGAFGGATLSREIAAALAAFPPLAPYAPALGIAAVVAGITFLSLVVGELVPKRIAMGNPEGIARSVAAPLQRLARAAGPAVDFLSWVTEGVLRLIGFRASGQQAVSEEEIRKLVEEGVEAGVFANTEPELVESVLALDRTPVKEIMTPRAQVIFLNRDEPHSAFWHKVVAGAQSILPVYGGNRDDIAGMVTVQSIYANLAAGIEVRLADLVVPPLIVPTLQPVSRLLDDFKRTGCHAALVADEFGEIVGMVTLVDVLEGIVGDIPSPEDRARPRARKRGDGSWLADGMMGVDAVEKDLGLPPLRGEGDGDYETLAGFVAYRLGHVPQEGEQFEWCGWRFEVIDMDRHRIDKVLLSPASPAPGEKPETPEDRIPPD